MSWIDDLEALGEAATYGPWFAESPVLGRMRPEDAAFIVAAKNHWPKIIAALRAAEQVRQVAYAKAITEDGEVRMCVTMEDWYPLPYALAALSDAVTGETT